MKNTIDRIKSFLSNNQKLLDKDLYTVYRELKLKFELKLKECVEFKKKIRISNNEIGSIN